MNGSIVSFHERTTPHHNQKSPGEKRVQSSGVSPPLSTVLDQSQEYCGWIGWMDDLYSYLYVGIRSHQEVFISSPIMDSLNGFFYLNQSTVALLRTTYT